MVSVFLLSILIPWQSPQQILERIFFLCSLYLSGRLGASGLLLFLIPGIAGRKGTAVLAAFKDVDSLQIYSTPKLLL